MRLRSGWRCPARAWWRAAAACLAAAGLSIACAQTAPAPSYAAGAYDGRPSAEQLAALGRRLFFDPRLSASGRQSCASCHDPAHAFGPPNGLAVQLGGPDGTTQGHRSAPSLRYLRTRPRFVERYFEDDDGGGDDDAGPTGGLTWDGRVDALRDQVSIPLFAPHEMANQSPQALRDGLRQSANAAAFAAAFSATGEDVFDHPDQVVGWLGAALEAYQQTAAEFEPYTSKFDAYLRKQVVLTPQERRGLALFDDPNKGNCAKCHPDTVSVRGAFPVFTDFGHEAVGAPRNRTLAINRDPSHYDLGLCGPERTDLERHTEFCGDFRTPSLRNVATRGAFFHNGVMHSLRDAVAFYALRDLDPARWYGRDATGHARRFDDLPAAYRANVNADPPFQPLPNGKPRLNARDIDDLVAFLKTLGDGYVPPAASASTFLHPSVTKPHGS